MQHVMRKGWSYIKDSEDFIKKSHKLGKIPVFFPSIPHNVGLRTLKEAH